MLAYKYVISYKPNKKSNKQFILKVTALNYKQAMKLAKIQNDLARVNHRLGKISNREFNRCSKSLKIVDIKISLWKWIKLKLGI